MVSEQFWILAPLKSSNLLIDSAIFFLFSQKFKVFREKAATECNGLGFLRYSPLQKNNRQMSNQRQLNHFHFYKRPTLNFEIRKLEKFQILGNDCCLLHLGFDLVLGLVPLAFCSDCRFHLALVDPRVAYRSQLVCLSALLVEVLVVLLLSFASPMVLQAQPHFVSLLPNHPFLLVGRGAHSTVVCVSPSLLPHASPTSAICYLLVSRRQMRAGNG